MTTTITRSGHVLLVVGALLHGSAASAQDDPHWNKNTCEVCHEVAAPAPGNLGVRAASTEQLCDTCHGSRGHARPCRHLSGFPAGDHDMLEGYRESLEDGQIVCTTCHDLSFQCQNPSKRFSFVNPGFIRDRVSRDKGEQCYGCHDKTDYEKLNPHDGITGNPPRPTCLLCHSRFPEDDESGGLLTEFNMEHDLNDVCRGCHRVQPHPNVGFSYKLVASWVHMVVPSPEILENMRRAEKESGIEMPLSPLNGQVFCATCHDPHGFNSSDAATQQPRSRLRVDDICQACHDK